MANQEIARRLLAEFTGTAGLVAAVVGSGIMAESLAGGNSAIALLANTIATGAALTALILTFAPVSGAHLNPVVSLSAALNGDSPHRLMSLYAVAQTAGAVIGVGLANTMFTLPAFLASTKVRTGPGPWLGEFIATFGLVGTVIAVGRRHSPLSTAVAVAAYIMAAYWFTSSTSFANPAVTVARGLSDTFTGIRPADVPAFVVSQLLGGIAAAFFFNWLVPKQVNDP